ncbi:MAG: ABC transporter ATP-binding protein [Chloroflexota bacterium]
MAIIQTINLTKKYGDLLAVDRVSLEIAEGECLGLLGPNGAGKTTLIRMITAVSPPTEGEILVQGNRLTSQARQVKAIMGVVPQLDNLDPDLTVEQNLLTFARYFSIPKQEASRRCLAVLKLFELEGKRRSHLKELSGGMKRRLLIARGLINQPHIMVLDEPTIGLDPQAKYLVWRQLAELKARGVTQLLCTQNMEEAAALCDRVAIMHQGQILGLDTPRELISRYAGQQVWEIGPDPADKGEIIQELARRHLDFDDAGDRIQVFHLETVEPLDGITKAGDRPRPRPATLEDVFFRLTGRGLNE